MLKCVVKIFSLNITEYLKIIDTFKYTYSLKSIYKHFHRNIIRLHADSNDNLYVYLSQINNNKNLAIKLEKVAKDLA